MTNRLIALGALALIACGGAYTQLPQEEQDVWRRCWNTMQTPVCGESTDQAYLGACERQNMRSWSELAGQGAREEWLLGHGCPASMVFPGETREATEGE